MARIEIAFDRADQRRRLHRREQMAEEALLGGFERRAGGGLGLLVQRAVAAGDVGGLHRRIEIVMDDGEGLGVGVIDAPLFVGELVFNQLVFDTVIGERPGGVEAERTQIAREHFHGRHAAVLDGFDEFGAGGEGKILAAP